MTHFSGLTSGSGLSDVLSAFPRNSERLLRLLDDIMCSKGALTRGEREAVAAFISQQNTTPYCVFYHTLFSEVFAGPVEETSRRIALLLSYALAIHRRDSEMIKTAFDAALHGGWSEAAIYEVVEVCGIFDFINAIVLASGIETPAGPLSPSPTAEGLRRSYAAMADAIKN